MESIVKTVDEDTLDTLTPKYIILFGKCVGIFFSRKNVFHRILGNHANTYGFTKSLVEQLVYDYSNKFPTVIARPPISEYEIEIIVTISFFFDSIIPFNYKLTFINKT